jgi:NAD(P)-dependent dehydrogenase (short-subunit alcohol dehydrogenase family)
MSLVLAGKTAVVTGGSSGIGLAIAVAVADAGAAVHVLARRTVPVEEAAAAVRIEGSIAAHRVDVSDAAAVRGWAATFGDPVDILVCAAGINIPKRRLGELTDASWADVISTNLNGAFFATSALLPKLRTSAGDIVYISSVAAAWPDHSGPAYGASKAGLLGLARGAGLDEYGRGIRVCTILPGLVNTAILDRRPKPPSDDMRALFVQPEDVAAACMAALAMPKRACITEITIVASQLQSMGNTQAATPAIPEL